MTAPPCVPDPAAFGPGKCRAEGRRAVRVMKLMRARRAVRAVRAALASLLLVAAPLQAWDSDAMSAAAQRLGEPAVAALPALQALLRSAAGMTDADRLQAINRFFNVRIAFATDLAVWGEEDHWASPLETLSRGRGDCEDYAIAKYASLLAAGVAPARLRLVYVRAQLVRRGEPAAALPHIVLAYQAGGDDEPLILDNLRAEVLPASARPDLSPVFSFGSEGLWHGNGAARAGDPLQRLSRWREVWAKMRAEGFV